MKGVFLSIMMLKSLWLLPLVNIINKNVKVNIVNLRRRQAEWWGNLDKLALGPKPPRTSAKMQFSQKQIQIQTNTNTNWQGPKPPIASAKMQFSQKQLLKSNRKLEWEEIYPQLQLLLLVTDCQMNKCILCFAFYFWGVNSRSLSLLTKYVQK